MKKVITCFFISAFSVCSFCQDQNLTKQDYLDKSKKQKSTALALVVCGGAITLLGLLIGTAQVASDPMFPLSDDQDYTVPSIMVGVGLTSMVGSVPFFIASSNNKMKAMKATACFKLERAELLSGAALHKQRYPAVSLRINF